MSYTENSNKQPRKVPSRHVTPSYIDLLLVLPTANPTSTSVYSVVIHVPLPIGGILRPSPVNLPSLLYQQSINAVY
ncbi:hypothetical protein ACTXT7_002983 [Hymenolepis weldensis]